MRATVWSLAAVVGLASCETDSDQIAQATLFNGPASKIRACFGRPDQRIPVGVEQIWVYRIGHLHVQGWLPAFGNDERPTFSAPDPDCEARFTIDSHGVRGIAYTDSKGAPIPQGETCEIAVRECVSRGS